MYDVSALDSRIPLGSELPVRCAAHPRMHVEALLLVLVLASCAQVESHRHYSCRNDYCCVQGLTEALKQLGSSCSCLVLDLLTCLLECSYATRTCVHSAACVWITVHYPTIVAVTTASRLGLGSDQGARADARPVTSFVLGFHVLLHQEVLKTHSIEAYLFNHQADTLQSKTAFPLVLPRLFGCANVL